MKFEELIQELQGGILKHARIENFTLSYEQTIQLQQAISSSHSLERISFENLKFSGNDAHKCSKAICDGICTSQTIRIVDNVCQIQGIDQNQIGRYQNLTASRSGASKQVPAPSTHGNNIMDNVRERQTAAQREEEVRQVVKVQNLRAYSNVSPK